MEEEGEPVVECQGHGEGGIGSIGSKGSKGSNGSNGSNGSKGFMELRSLGSKVLGLRFKG